MKTAEALSLTVRRLDERFLALARSSGLEDGATLAVLGLFGDALYAVNAGDSRAVCAVSRTSPGICEVSEGQIRAPCESEVSGGASAFLPESQNSQMSRFGTFEISASPGAALALTRDHKPGPARPYVEAAGGCVHPRAFRAPGHLVLVGPDRIYPGGLAVARGLGDLLFKDSAYLHNLGVVRPLVVADPEVLVIPTPIVDFALVGCDGLWDVFSTAEAVRLARVLLVVFYSQSPVKRDVVRGLGLEPERLRLESVPQLAAQALCRLALERGSGDNVSVCVLVFERFLAGLVRSGEGAEGSDSAENVLWYGKRSGKPGRLLGGKHAESWSTTSTEAIRRSLDRLVGLFDAEPGQAVGVARLLGWAALLERELGIEGAEDEVVGPWGSPSGQTCEA